MDNTNVEPVEGATWTLAVQKGTDGTDGADGNTVLYGTDDPGPTDGADGNYYINTSTDTIFGPKAAGTWPAGTSLIGPEGDPATVEIASVTTGAPGTAATVENIGTTTNVELEITIPEGQPGTDADPTEVHPVDTPPVYSGLADGTIVWLRDTTPI